MGDALMYRSMAAAIVVATMGITRSEDYDPAPRQEPTGPTDADLARKAAAEAKRERKRLKRAAVRAR